MSQLNCSKPKLMCILIISIECSVHVSSFCIVYYKKDTILEFKIRSVHLSYDVQLVKDIVIIGCFCNIISSLVYTVCGNIAYAACLLKSVSFVSVIF